MSKEKLQEIKDEVAQENEWADWANMDNSDLEDWEVAMARQEMITELMKLAYNKALEDAAENAIITYVLDNEGVYNLPVVDKQSIRKLKI